MGGALTIAALTIAPEADAGTCYYGVPDLVKFDVSKIKGPVYAYFGEKDTVKGFSDPEAAKRLEATCKAAGVDFSLE